MSSRRNRGPGGFTLVELLVAMLVAVIVVGAALALLRGQQRAFFASAQDRAEQETGRLALGDMLQNLRLAGYGLDPTMAFDFGQATTVMDRAPTGPGVPAVVFGGDAAGVTGFACAAPVQCRDSVNGPDELAFQYRSPYFNRPLVAVPDLDTLVIQGPLNQPLFDGQVLQVACLQGAMTWAYVQVGGFVPASPVLGVVRIPLRGGQGLDFPRQNQALGDACFLANAQVMKVERFRYFIDTYQEDGQRVPWATPGARPYLMLDRGLRDQAGNAVTDVVAPDIEDLQVGYVFPLSLPGTQLVGEESGVQLANNTGDGKGIELAPPGGIPTYQTARLSAIRSSHHPANVRAVRVAVLVRGPTPDAQQTDPTLPAVGNRPALAGEPLYRRSAFQTSVAIPNMESRAPIFPSLGTGADQLNVGGG